MLYRLLGYYLKAKLLRLVLARIKGTRFMKSKNLKTMNLMTYILELAGMYLLKKRKGTR
ncbi:hypothetical protein [Legionella shakespearei]|uniref:Uncharacterized protein n=1 Tax=Legionella shakespearei DSM 23087 TaxID=1122169 RepID=A0A0W0YHN9_9GAMM|nr:hypothetical protein [Legionella shakespearei]KTD56472.1 hypothetical protein Lsha_2871 [Legionella shakespearei DSM 23087]